MHPRRPSSSLQRNLNYDDPGIMGQSHLNSYDISPYQSTPRKDNPSVNVHYGPGQGVFGQSKPYLSAISRSTNPVPTKYSGTATNGAHRSTRSPSPTKTSIAGTSPSTFVDIDNSTIQRQRKELQLLVNELKDRDRELNEMVDSHQKQLISWETDKKRVLVLERHVPKLRSDLKKRTEQVRILKERLRMTEQSAQMKTKELETTQMHLQQASDQANMSSHQVEELKDRNENMARSIQELSTSLGQLQAKEQELATTLKLKENELTDVSAKVEDLAKRTKSLNNSLQESRKNETLLKSERDQWREQHQVIKHEVEKLRADLNNHYNNEDEYQNELAHVKQELLATQKELFLAGEREKRKDQLVELSKSKQERTETELQHLRKVFERQQRELMMLQQQVQEQDITDRLSDLNTEDDLSDISSAYKPKSKQPDDFLADLDHFSYQETGKNIDYTDIYLNKDRIPHGTSLPVPNISRSMNGKANSNSFKGNTSLDGNNLTKSPTGSYLDSGDTTKAVKNDSATEKLQRLLEESRQMVNSLEAQSPISSIQSTPERQDIRNRGTEKSFSTPGDERCRSPPLLRHLDNMEL
ncbi:coiled-coil domain-containing protein 62-like [Rhopilema esculentum]|uniref:coiled-coil domain-containing protein 62-like n=1 Tax=Rhopilema esculentum TaxID=499914 RepID=UPI0031E28867|eukprot:gene15172-6366_t